jgi:hypothetical protein
MFHVEELMSLEYNARRLWTGTLHVVVKCGDIGRNRGRM